MRIAVLASSYPRFQGDGTAPFVKSIAEALVKFGHDVEVIAPYDVEVKPTGSKGVKIHRFKYALIKSFHIMGHGRALESDVRLRPVAILLLPFYLIAAFITLLRVTQRQKTEVIHVHWVLPNGPVAAMVAWFRRIPFVVSLHGSDMFMARKNRLYRVVARWVFIQASSVTACSPELKKYALELGAPKTTELFAWGADPQVFKPADNLPELRLKLGWNDGIIITTLGRLVYKKGFDILLKALPPVLNKYPLVKVIIGGDGPLLVELHDLAKAIGISESVQFIGRVPWNEVSAILAAGNIFVLPSVRDVAGNLDGLPTVLLEAMGCGSAIIASDIGGVSLAIRNHENGLLVNPGSVDELTQALLKLVNDLAYREILGEAARKTVVDELNWENVVRRIEKYSCSHFNGPN
jgi:glycosyltransferase involved in cell wall biosynthesis